MFEFWLVLGFVLVILEVAMGFTLVLFFAGMGALTTALLLHYSYIGDDAVSTQVAVFFVATTLWAISSWKPFKHIVAKLRSHNSYNNIAGQEVQIIDADLVKGETGNAKWSGTVVRVKLDDDSPSEVLTVGSIAKVKEIKDNIFIVS